jgi:predicted AAA+ superfamily ATPase
LKSLSFSPIVGLLGHRQVGKTTIAEMLSKHYVTLDSPDDLSLAMADAQSFLVQHQGAPTAIDECQLAPPLFSALKEWVRTHKRPGQFLLTGSVRFSSRKAIRESLTGRIVAWELLPMDWAEQFDRKLSDSLIRLSRNFDTALKRDTEFSAASYHRAIHNGGLPGVFGVRDPAIRAQRFETQINTVLERDLRLLIQTTLPFRSLRQLFVSLAKQVGAPLDVTSLARETRISMPTLRKLLPVFESLFLLRTLPSEGNYRKPVVFFEDVGELNHLLALDDSDPRLFLSFLYQNLRTQFHYRPELGVTLFSFRTIAGQSVPLCFRFPSKRVLGLIPLQSEDSISDALKSAKVFRKTYPNAHALIVGLKDKDLVVEQGIRWLGVSRLL